METVNITRTIGKKIKQLRQKEGWNQAEVAKRLELSIPAFSKIETGITDPNISRLNQIAKLFNVHPKDLIIDDKDLLTLDRKVEIDDLVNKLANREKEIIKLQAKTIDLYEELEKLRRA